MLLFCAYGLSVTHPVVTPQHLALASLASLARPSPPTGRWPAARGTLAALHDLRGRRAIPAQSDESASEPAGGGSGWRDRACHARLHHANARSTPHIRSIRAPLLPAQEPRANQMVVFRLDSIATLRHVPAERRHFQHSASKSGGSRTDREQRQQPEPPRRARRSTQSDTCAPLNQKAPPHQLAKPSTLESNMQCLTAHDASPNTGAAQQWRPPQS